MDKKAYFMYYVNRPVESEEPKWRTLYSGTITKSGTYTYDTPIPDDVTEIYINFDIVWNPTSVPKTLDKREKEFGWADTVFRNSSNSGVLTIYQYNSSTKCIYVRNFTRNNFEVSSLNMTSFTISNIQVYY